MHGTRVPVLWVAALVSCGTRSPIADCFGTGCDLSQAMRAEPVTYEPRGVSASGVSPLVDAAPTDPLPPGAGKWQPSHRRHPLGRLDHGSDVAVVVRDRPRQARPDSK